VLLASLVLLGAASPAQEPAVQVIPTRLDRVTVYPEQALVERVLEVQSDRAGDLSFDLGPLPVLARKASFQLRVESGPAEVQGMETSIRNSTGSESPLVVELKERLDGIQSLQREIKTKLVGIEGQQAVLDAMVASVANRAEPLTEEELLPILSLIRSQTETLDEQRAHFQGEDAQLSDTIDELNRKIAAAIGQARPFQTLHVPLRFERPGTAQLRLLYLVSSANWEPSYDVHVSSDLTGVSISQVARVRQNTGEDWDNVEIQLSTSMPSIGLDPPELPSRFYVLPYPGAPDLNGLAALGYDGGDLAALDASGGAGALSLSNANYQSMGLAASFQIVGARTVPSGGEPSQFLLTSLPMQVSPERYVVPSVSDQAYLRAEVLYSGDKPLVSGSAKVYLGPDFLGETQMPVLHRGDRTTIHLGIDPNLTVKFETLSDKRDDPGILSSTAHRTRVFRADLRLSPNSGPVEILVEEVLPLTRDDRIEISPVQMQPAPLRDAKSMKLRENGIYRWRIRLAPGASQRITWGYDAAFDEDLNPVFTER
jgi:uncharacterized protein (TIGR02231 family)